MDENGSGMLACLGSSDRPLRENQISQFPLCSAPPSFASLLSRFSSLLSFSPHAMIAYLERP